MASNAKRGYYGVLDDWQNDWPIIKEPVEKFRHPGDFPEAK